MISKKEIKEIARELNKKISKETYEKLDQEIILLIKNKLKDASINADFNARKIIKEKDLEFED
jgi:histone H3/H4